MTSMAINFSSDGSNQQSLQARTIDFFTIVQIALFFSIFIPFQWFILYPGTKDPYNSSQGRYT